MPPAPLGWYFHYFLTESYCDCGHRLKETGITADVLIYTRHGTSKGKHLEFGFNIDFIDLNKGAIFGQKCLRRETKFTHFCKDMI